MKLLIIICLAACCFLNADAQSVPTEIGRGQLCPDFTCQQVLNWQHKNLHRSEFKGKLLIIDFWGTYCEPCVRFLPKLLALQNKYRRDMQVITVSSEPMVTVKKFLSYRPELRTQKIPFVTDDKILRKYFPHNVVPHEILIAPDGHVLAITSDDEISETTIQQYLANGTVNVDEKKDFDYDSKKPLLTGGLGKGVTLSGDKILYNTIITKYIKGLPGMEAWENLPGDMGKIVCYNSAIPFLYQSAFYLKSKPNLGANDPDFSIRLPARFIWEAKDSTLFPWSAKYHDRFNKIPDSLKYFCFELTIAEKDTPTFNKVAVDELNRFFGSKYGIEGAKEKRMIDCWVMTLDSTPDLLKSKSSKEADTLDKAAQRIFISHCSLTTFLYLWENKFLYLGKIPIVDETGYKKPIDLDLKVDPSNFEEVQAALKPYGITFTKGKRMLDVIVVRDKH